MEKKLFRTFAVVFMALFCVQVLPAAECLLNLPLNEGPGIKIKDASVFTNSLSIEGDKWQELAPGKYARKFEGKRNSVRVFGDKLCPDQFTVSFWLLPHPTPETEKDQIMFHSANTVGSGWGGGYSLYVRPKAGMYELQLVIRLEGQTWCGPIGRIAADKFSFVTVIYDRKNIICFVNGERTFEKAETRAITYGSNKNDIMIGTASWGNFPFHGLLNDFRFYNGALTSDEINVLYQKSVGAMAYREKTTVKDENYYTDDKLFGPDYKKCRNLLQNPSFEAGGRYWKAGVGFDVFECPFKIDNAESHGGKSSLWLRGATGKRELVIVYSFAVPVEPERDYTLSFFAKSDKSVSLEVYNFSGVHPEHPGSKVFKLTPQWQRYSVSFKSKNAVLAPKFNIARFPKEDCDARIDDIQLEAGSEMTEYTEKPVIGRLLMSGKYNTIQPGEKANAVFQIMGKPDEKGRLHLEVKDYTGTWIKDRTIDFVLGKDGQWQTPCAELDSLPKGDFVIRAGYKLQSGYEDSDYFRFAVMEYVRADSPLKYFFATIPSYPVDMERTLALLSHYGYGWLRSSPALPSKETCRLMDKYGFQFQAGLLFYFNTPYDLDGADGFKAPNFSFKYEDRAAVVGPEKYPDIIESCRRVAKSRPDIKLWMTENESLGGTRTNQAEWVRQYSAMIGAVAKAVKEVNPGAKVITPTTTQIYQRDGQEAIAEFIREQGTNLNTLFDLVGAHTYRPRPEQPDFDEDISAMIKMLEKHGFNGNISFDEDMYYTRHNIPKFGLDVTRFADFWSPKMSLSYDMGAGERMASAYNARHWLIALKYYPKVERALLLTLGDSYLDMEVTPTLFNWAPNTLRHIFGKDCRFIQEIPLCDDVRCYLYKDGDGFEVAAIWNINEDIDREKRLPLAAKLPFSSFEVEMIDFVGNSLNFKAGDTMKIYPTPTFLRRKPSGGFFAAMRDRVAGFIKSVILRQERESFVVMLGKLEVQGGNKRLVKMTTEIVDQKNVAVKVKNLTSGVVSGTLAIHSGGDAREDLSLPVAGEKLVSVKLPELNDKTINKVPLQINFTGPDGKSQSNEASFKMLLCKKAASPLIVDGDLADWPAGSGVKLDGLLQDYTVPPALLAKYPQPKKWNGPEDLSATLYTAWDKEYFYLAIDVKDDLFCPAPVGKASWEYDSVQIYFDTTCDARNLKSKNYDSTDYNYNACYRDDKMEVSRNPVPDWQLCFLNVGPAPKVKAAFMKTEKGYIYEFAFPLSELAPMRLEKNHSIGFAVLLNENDNDYRKRVISLTAPGREPYMNPTAWPAMLLVE